MLRSHLKVTIFQLRERPPLTMFARKSCNFGLEELPRARLREQAFASNKFARRHSKSASTAMISEESRVGTAEIAKSPQFLNIDHTNLRRGSGAQIRNRKKSSVF